MFVKQFEPKVAQWHRLLWSGVSLMPMASARHDHWEVVAGVVGCVTKVAANDDRRVVQQGAVTFLDLVHVGEELIDMFDDVHLQFDSVDQACSGFLRDVTVYANLPLRRDLNGPINPVQAECDHTSRIGSKSEPRQF